MHAVCYLTWESKRLGITVRTPSNVKSPNLPAHNSAQTKHIGWVVWVEIATGNIIPSPNPPRSTSVVSARQRRGRSMPNPMRQGRVRA